ncbi:TniQ family protein [Agrobacterium sp. NPDC058088]|uniref:TniQ family protein n=1 Tax=Agrobacterium sp. NPDC058088 TaxID=3346335 RepID=UPI0036D87480
MTSRILNTGFHIEVTERYHNLIGDRWPVVIKPQPDELVSSWIHRLAIANGIAPLQLAFLLDLGGGMWSARLDLKLPIKLVDRLAMLTGLHSETILSMVVTEAAITSLMFPLRKQAGSNQSVWLQYCSFCLAGDGVPYFRRQWRQASRVSCFTHGHGLRDRCPACRTGIIAFSQTAVIPQHFCVRCDFDLRWAPRAQISRAARHLERAIEETLTVEKTNDRGTIGKLVQRVLQVPLLAGTTGAKTLTNLSTSARIRCFEQLSIQPRHWTQNDIKAAIADWRKMKLAGDGNQNIVPFPVNCLQRLECQKSPRSVLVDSDRVELFRSFWLIMQAGKRAKVRRRNTSNI